jgi:hypothetical protein
MNHHVVNDPIRRSAIDRIHHEELERQQAILDAFEHDKLQAVFQVRALIARWGLERVQVWALNQAKELELL